MATAFDLKAEFAKLKMLQGRSAHTTRDQQTESSAELATYRDGSIFTTKFTGSSTWERHPNGDEYVQIQDGTTTFDLETATGIETLELAAGMMIVVPKGAWHRFRSPGGVSLLTITPLPTEHVRTETDDPRRG
jgi:mannose-6-phosphate isomerase-like protein (cupin superfamily)